jgi:heme-degrading monooxygenase HmoA
MYTRIVHCTVKPEKKTEFDRTLTNELLPRIKQQPGFIDVVEMYSQTNPNEFVCMTFWKSQEAVNRYTSELFPTVVQRLTPTLSGEAKVDTYSVQTSTPHRIAAGKAA